MTKAAIEPNGVLQTWVQDYLATGWALCPIPAGQKAPKLKGWNRRENAILRRGQAGLITDNVGLLHAFSGTVSIDIDDYQLAEPFLMSRGINLEALLGAPEAVLIDSGRPNRCKLLYRHSDPLQYRKMATYGLELRCADSKGGSVQDVLPPSIHPNGNPYIWAGHGHFSNLPALPQDLLDLWLSAPECQHRFRFDPL